MIGARGETIQAEEKSIEANRRKLTLNTIDNRKEKVMEVVVKSTREG